MKGILLVVFVFSVFIAVCTGRGREGEKSVLEGCKNLVQATEEDVLTIFDHKIPQSRSGKCLLKCVQEEIGMVKNGKLSLDRFRAIVDMDFEGDTKALNTMNEILDECDKVNDLDDCEQSAKLADCIFRAGAKRGIDFKGDIKDSIDSRQL